ncbi:hypothetical protein [Saccharothrix sp. Mg75]|uniref:hypothetical protein n=1 Tax=Saccharothrix sp. Mg75 TaxID=3445357 RepID=UPI003EEB1021
MGIDVAAELSLGLDDRDDAWRFIRWYAEHFAAPLEDGDGHAVEEAEERLGVRLPAAVREAYALFGRRADLTSNQDELLAPDELLLSGDVLVYRADHRARAHWGWRCTTPTTRRCSCAPTPPAPGSRGWTGSRGPAWSSCCPSRCSRATT